MRHRIARWTLITLLGAATAAASRPQTREELADRVREKATVRVRESFDLPCPSATVLASLQHPLVMAALWNSYEFTPAYRVTPGEEGAVHVVDPTGLTGDLWTISAAPERVVLLGTGTLTHWGIPGLRHGTATFDVALATRGDSTRMDITVSLKPDVWLARAGLWMLAPIAHGRIEKRMKNNVRDAAVILADIVQRPDSVAARLSGELRSDFAAAFAR